jgi:hypothetical protein
MRCATCSRQTSGTKWCCAACKSRWKGRLERSVPPSDKEYAKHLKGALSKTCPVCGASFKATRKPQRCCSNACVVRGRMRASKGQPVLDKEWSAWKSSQRRTDGLKTCPKCGHDKPLDAEHFGSGRNKYDPSRKFSSWCRSCSNTWSAERNRRRRIEVLRHYSQGEPRCDCCGERELDFLAIDHIEGGGSKHHKAIKSSIHTWLISQHFPSGFRVLCHNCNMARGLYGSCPHERKRSER